MAKKHFIAAGICGIGLILSLALRKPEKFQYVDINELRRAGIYKPGNQPNFGLQQKDSLYYLIGKRGDFEALRFALVNPGDITPNQVTALSNWIAGARLIQDTTKVNSVKKK